MKFEYAGPVGSPSTPPHIHDEYGTVHFSSHLTFLPNKSPEEVTREGYWRNGQVEGDVAEKLYDTQRQEGLRRWRRLRCTRSESCDAPNSPPLGFRSEAGGLGWVLARWEVTRTVCKGTMAETVAARVGPGSRLNLLMVAEILRTIARSTRRWVGWPSFSLCTATRQEKGMLRAVFHFRDQRVGNTQESTLLSVNYNSSGQLLLIPRRRRSLLS